ncbi:FecR family protein [Ferruginibacter sp.]|nr:FecR family protein [Ferruginibacter sp.]
MIKGKEYYEHLMVQYLHNNCSPQEVKELFDHIQEDSSNKLLLQQMQASFNNMLQDKQEQQPLEWSRKMQETLINKIQPQAKVVPLYKKWLPRVAAAILVVSFSVAAYQYYTKKEVQPAIQIANNNTPSLPKDILPGSDKALLTLADGTVIVLDEVKNGTVAKQGNISVNKKNGLVIYDASNASSSSAAITFNTISTPKGGQYQIVLPDGSNVWLNAASSLRFPTAFAGTQRNVELKGEGYFEIAKNAAMPFYVKVNNMEVEVLGTHFNLMAYDNEDAVKTTLLEGAVKINYGATAKTLKPGQQGKFNNTSGAINVITTDTEEAVAWKNGYFQFTNEDIKSIMRQFARWYDVEVSYEGIEKPRYFSGEISRTVSLSKALKVLELSNVKFRIDEKKIVVLF